MNYDALADYASDRITGLTDQLQFHLKNGDEVNAAIVLSDIKELAHHMDDEEYDFFFQTYHRHMSDSQGVDFEIIHGDTELMFGGI